MKFRGNKPFKPKRSNPGGNARRQLLDMGREKYFRFDLDDMLVDFKIDENKNTIAATILNKMTSQSMDDALEYISRIKDSGALDDEKEGRLRGLLIRYSRWR
ncbi:MAG: hypothetical protein NTU61_01450 [Candidatus Altiarchaeota archaeon]|nr:hypothetical protein [Candidatus Altiarchaeota archaeon]